MTGDVLQLEETFDYFLDAIQPVVHSNDIRTRIIKFLREIIENKIHDVFLIPSGSTCSRTYLPDGDLDLVLLSNHRSSSTLSLSASTEPSIPSSSEIQLLNQLFTCLCNEIERKENNNSPFPDFTIRNIELINARTKLLHCVVNNIGIDISFNQIGALSGLIFVEKVDEFIGNQFLFKRSLLLIKVKHPSPTLYLLFFNSFFVF
jgi:DNA polymerase sigma